MTKFDFGRTVATIALTIVCSSVAVIGAVGPASTVRPSPTAIHAVA